MSALINVGRGGDLAASWVIPESRECKEGDLFEKDKLLLRSDVAHALCDRVRILRKSESSYPTETVFDHPNSISTIGSKFSRKFEKVKVAFDEIDPSIRERLDYLVSEDPREFKSVLARAWEVQQKRDDVELMRLRISAVFSKRTPIGCAKKALQCAEVGVTRARLSGSAEKLQEARDELKRCEVALSNAVIESMENRHSC